MSTIGREITYHNSLAIDGDLIEHSLHGTQKGFRRLVFPGLLGQRLHRGLDVSILPRCRSLAKKSALDVIYEQRNSNPVIEQGGESTGVGKANKEDLVGVYRRHGVRQRVS